MVSQRQLPAIARTGVYAKRSQQVLQLRAHRVQALVRRMRQAMPWLQESDLAAMRAFAELEYLCAAIWNALDKGRSMFDKDGDVRRLAHDYRVFRQSQVVYMRELGMTPVARASLGVGGPKQLDIVGEFARDIQREKQAGKR